VRTYILYFPLNPHPQAMKALRSAPRNKRGVSSSNGAAVTAKAPRLYPSYIASDH